MMTENEENLPEKKNLPEENKLPEENSSSEDHQLSAEPSGKPEFVPPYKKEEVKKGASNIKILGFNLLIFAIYTVAAIAADQSQGAATALLIAFFQFVICTVLAIAYKRAVWFLSGLLVLIIGFGTCINNFHMGPMN